MKFKVLVAGVLAAATLCTVASVAGAAPPGTGWDDVNDQVVGAGSDTTYAHMQYAERLYNQANGCDTNNTTGSATVGNCLTGPTQGQTNVQGNWDHDYFVSKYPTGSGAGVKELQLGTANYARSSSGRKSAGGGQGDVNFWAYGKDGLVVVTFGNRLPGDITIAQLTNIWNCTNQTWGAALGTSDPTPIKPWGMNASSGTYAKFNSFLGLADVNAGSCVQKLDNGIFPFENDVKQLNTDSKWATIGNDSIWWMSYAEYKSFSYKRQDAQAWTLGGIAASNGSISNNTYGMTRFIYHVTLKADATPVGTTEAVTGTVGGKGGAVRQFTEWMCKASTSHSNNLFSGLTNYQELTNVYSTTGFIRLPVAERTNGICKVEVGLA